MYLTPSPKDWPGNAVRRPPASRLRPSAQRVHACPGRYSRVCRSAPASPWRWQRRALMRFIAGCALAETINGLYKGELIRRRNLWKTKESLELATLEWVSWFNHHRLLEPIGYIPPGEAEANYYQQLEEKSEPRFHVNQTASKKHGSIQEPSGYPISHHSLDV